MAQALLSMTAIGKTFGAVTALQKAEFHLEKGEVHAILGVNGAGKSTLIKILSGVYQQDEGTIKLDGVDIRLESPKAAKEQGIYCVYQEVDTAIVAELTVAENILLDTFAGKGNLFVSRQKINERARLALRELQVDHINVQQKAARLTLAEKQMVLIARALVHSAKIIIFDEPTAPLSIHESEKLYAVIAKLKAQGVGCVFISHRLPEVFEISDRITVMREGTLVKTYDTSEADQDGVIEAMLGAALSHELEPRAHEIGNPLLEVENLSDGQKLKDLSLTVAAGEVVGVVGLVGAGKTELAKALFGGTPLTSGMMKLSGKTAKIKHPADAIKAGMALIPEERRKEGLFVQESLETNASFPNLKKFSKNLLLDRKAEKRFADEIIERLRIKTDSTETPLVHLSGGNQQKVAIGKWISLDSALYLFDEPTKGVDIGAKVDIFKLIRQLAESGKGCLYFSSEIHEAIGISDRILVMYNGQIVKELSRQEATQERILLYASGGKEELGETQKLGERQRDSVSV
ncbi:sugar ABC transporter ATP-binding protein [Microbacterium sp. APC 3898]|uniref:Sugar ABC transporter ATP-binding protein n=1 Tax=Planococcus notacanthi TaxID=3035188 RepID=A0ABT7ZJI2_9BACL|nr:MULTISPECIES: sugar ABC transporter ATP-binding protein [Terrabacteria group]MDN3427232.1 sugar ABC transporter ATP-binding protein [Planococcus sp. APC 4016]MDN3499513.1 sugar ABC transporter ATP-binding protein [Microbacterium sp. APC 3898]